MGAVAVSKGVGRGNGRMAGIVVGVDEGRKMNLKYIIRRVSDMRGL